MRQTLAIVALLFVAVAGSAAAQEVRLRLGPNKYAGSLEVALNKSRVLRLETSFTDILVGNPGIADALPLTDRSLYVLGKGLGSTTLSIYGRDGDVKTLVAVVDLVITQDLDGIKRRLHDLMPQERIAVRSAHDSVVLSGTVSSAKHVADAMALAERFAPGKVTNMLKVKGSQQVMLAVRFAEVKRTALKDLGINHQVIAKIGAVTLSSFAGPAALGQTLFPAPFNLFNISGSSRNVQFDALINALEQKGIIKTLAEPNLVALSGDTASFLAGGEFPIPVAQSGSGSGGNQTITIEFKQFGVGLSFTPTVLADDTISLVVAPEVSALDTSTEINISGVRIPGLVTRRVKTTVELRHGQSFAIAGLLQKEFNNSINQIPYLGNVPVLGALFRSADYQRNETELVVIVTPYLVKPGSLADLRVPTDGARLPSDTEFFLKGRVEGKPLPPGPAPVPPRTSSALSDSRITGGGLDGNLGHIVR
jgi:pilus assembly protein CpaC